MQNLIVLCQSCFTWIESQSDQCPECGLDIDLDRPDLDQEALAEIVGQPQKILGCVSIERRQLPSFGHLIETTQGLLFLPRLHRRVNGAWEGVTSQNLPSWWPFRGDLASPRFLSWLRRPFGVTTPGESKDTVPPQEETLSLAERLMESPGAFFVPRRSIRGFTARRRTIKLDRLPLRSITFFDETEEGTLMTLLTTLHAQAATNKPIEPLS